jgi:glucokinase
MILSADIGGTKVNIALYEQLNNSIKLYSEAQYQSKEYPTLEQIIKHFQTKHPKVAIQKACFAIAGPVINQTCNTTNLPWSISTKKLQDILGIKDIVLINDLEATAYGMLYLEQKDFHILQNTQQKDGNKAIIAAGTGLGEAMLFFDGKDYHPIACEGGHTDFAPQDELQDELLVFLREKFPDHVSYERVVSGDGISLLYHFLCEHHKKIPHFSVAKSDPSIDTNSIITKLALNNDDPIASKTLELFVKIYAAEAGNLALKSMSLGGVYIGGGIAPKIIPFIEKYFLESFLAKGRFRDLLATMQVCIALEPKTALLGAAHYAKNKLKNID